ncbi:GNAT family N-acetyltransferase [Natronosalvus caseinilyticus]|uniref:GNAT family N-acetyltransferase n=1 Tax=Natronosalvus caseinilyticus TaxID=2953747 RepID=UPI0028B1EAF2|nr:GNAT family N-acetyltransferase [Natronosalvus caseinilyticus]
MDDVRIRRATVGDAAELVATYHNAYRENRRLGFPAKAETVTEDEVVEWIRNHRVYVAVLGADTGEEGDGAESGCGEVVGGVRLESTDPGRMKLSRLGVHEQCQGAGIGTALLNRAEAVARDAGIETVWLTTPEDHPYLPDLYRRREYEGTGRYPLEYREYDEIVMEKELG